MCGISGIFNLSKDSVNINEVIEMNSAISHRGPDDHGSVLFSSFNDDVRPLEFRNDFSGEYSGKFNVAFTHRRLSIVDLSELGHQPMNLDNKYWLVYNGEIYNHTEIRKELEIDGVKFKSKTDTEVILFAYQKWGIECVKKFKGIFAFGLWDNLQKKMYLVRDRVGVKPLYYHKGMNSFFFSSEIKSILTVKSVSRNMNIDALSYYFSFLAVPPPSTMFEAVSKLDTGCFLTIDCKGSIEITQYWNPLDNFKEVTDQVGSVDELEEKLLNSISLRMMSDVPVGVFLSGGVDSSLIVAMMSKYTDQQINTLTIGYKDIETNEYDYAKKIADLYNTNHFELILDGKSSQKIIDEMVYYQDEPIADPVCIPIYELSKKAKELGISVILVGEGADELFAGYSNFKYYYQINKYLWQYLDYIPGPVRKFGAEVGKGIVSKTKFRKYLDCFDLMYEKKELYWSNAQKYYPYNIQKVIPNHYNENPYNFISDNVKRYENSNNSSYLGKLAYQELRMRLPELLLMRVDKMMMAASVEGRVPFLDHSIVEYSFSLSDDLKIRDGKTKYLLKKVAEKYLPNDIIYRKKMGFGFPINSFFNNGFEEYLKEIIYSTKLRNENIINYKFVDEMFELTNRKKVNYYGHLWTLANLSLWYDLWH